jgi:hypothetical protein
MPFRMPDDALVRRVDRNYALCWTWGVLPRFAPGAPAMSTTRPMVRAVGLARTQRITEGTAGPWANLNCSESRRWEADLMYLQASCAIPLPSTCPVAWRYLMRHVSLHPWSFA